MKQQHTLTFPRCPRFTPGKDTMHLFPPGPICPKIKPKRLSSQALRSCMTSVQRLLRGAVSNDGPFGGCYLVLTMLPAMTGRHARCVINVMRSRERKKLLQ